MSDRSFALALVILYTILILISLGDPAMVLAVGRLLMGEHLDLFFSLAPYGIIALVLVYLTFVKKETSAGSFIFLILICVILYFIERYLRGDREKIHLIEFALLGALIFRTAALWQLGRWAVYLLVAAAGLATVGIDELLQISFSLKVFSIRDVLVNSMAVALGAVTYGGLFLDLPPGPEEPQASS